MQSVERLKQTKYYLPVFSLALCVGIFFTEPSFAEDMSLYAKKVGDQQVAALSSIIVSEREIYLQLKLQDALKAGANVGQLAALERDLRLENELFSSTPAGQLRYEQAISKRSNDTYNIVKQDFFMGVSPIKSCTERGCLESYRFSDEYGEIQAQELFYDRDGSTILYRQFCGTYGSDVRQCFNVDSWQFVRQRWDKVHSEWRNSLD